MSSYRIHTIPVLTIIESGGTVTHAPLALDWAVGCPFNHVRSYCERKGWRVEPIVDNEPGVTTFSYKHSEYVLYSNGQNIVRITKDDEDISWQEVPDVLKGLL